MVYLEAGQWVDWAVPFEALRIMRIDTDRDFDGVADIGAVLRALSHVRPPSGAPLTIHRDGDGRFTSLMCGRPKRWRGDLYAKGDEILSRARSLPPGVPRERLEVEAEVLAEVLRFEARHRRPVLSEKGITTMSDVTDDILIELNHSAFTKSGFDTEIGNADKVRAIAVGASEDDRKNLYKVIGFLVEEAHGIEHLTSHNTVAKYRQAARRLGLTSADFAPGARHSVRLDYDAALVIDGEVG
jgi:hypothetical protein